MMLQQIRGKFEYLGKPFVNHKGKMILNPGDAERYETKIHKPLEEFIKEGIITATNDIYHFEVTDKCLKSELQVELTIAK